MVKKPVVLAAGILFLCIGLFVATRKPRPSNQTQVTQQAKYLVSAFNRGDNRALLSTLSSDFNAGGWTKARLQLALLRWKRQGIQATLSQNSISVKSTTEITITANLQARDSRTQEGVWSAPEAALTFRLERPTPDVPFLPGTWRLVTVSGASLPEASIAD